MIANKVLKSFYNWKLFVDLSTSRWDMLVKTEFGVYINSLGQHIHFLGNKNVALKVNLCSFSLSWFLLPTYFVKCKQNPPKFKFQRTISKFIKYEIKHFYVIHEVVQRWQRKVNRLTDVQSCWFAYYTSIIFDILIEVELFDPKVPIS